MTSEGPSAGGTAVSTSLWDRWRHFAVPIALMAIAEFGVELGLRPRYLLLIVVAAFLGILARAQRVRLDGAAWRAGAVALILSVGIATYTGAFAEDERLSATVAGVSSVLVGFAIVLWLVICEGSPAEGDSVARGAPPGGSRRSGIAVVGILAGAALLLTLVHWLAVGHGAMIGDETAYRLEASWLRYPHFGMPLDPSLGDFFRTPYTAVAGGHVIGQYSPGWPAVLHLASILHGEWWAPVILGVLNVWLTYSIARAIASERVALLSAALLAINPWFLNFHAGYMSHPLTMTCALGALRCLLPERTGATVSWSRTIGAGLLIGLSLATRPLSGAVIGASLLAWRTAHDRRLSRALFRFFLGAAIGTAPFVIWILYYNRETTGNALVFGYQFVHGALHSLGFGTRGLMEFDPLRGPRPYAIHFGAWDGAHYFVKYVLAMASFVPYALVLPIAALAYRPDDRRHWPELVPLLGLAVGYSAWWFFAPRFLESVLPLLLTLTVVLVMRIEDRWPQTARTLPWLAVAGSLVLAVPWRQKPWEVPDPWVGTIYVTERNVPVGFARVNDLHRRYGRLVVFVNDTASGMFSVGLNRLLLFNRNGLESDVVVARDLGARDSLLVQRLPNRTAIRLIWRAEEGKSPEPIVQIMGATRASP